VSVRLSKADAAYYREVFDRARAAGGIDAGIAAVVEAERLGRDPVTRSPVVDASLKALVAAIAEKHRIKPHNVLGPEMERQCTEARLELYAAMLDMGLRPTEVARYVGRDHSTVLSGAQRWRERNQAAANRADERRAA
jgi:hypothetical protein